ncbi:MAG: hypothetical protein SPL56_09190 [Lachnospiraceae bacterium]|nr:hypothetical protein [Lachnospiraceae bacterium]
MNIDSSAAGVDIDPSAADVDIVAHGSVRQYTIENMSEDKEGEESMDYEELYASLIQTEKTLNDNIKLGVRLGKTIGKDTESGDLKDLQKTLDQYAEVIEKQKAALEELRQKAGGFDAGAYFESGDFTNQMLECCRERGIDVHGEYPVFEMFPYRIRIDAGNQDLYMDRKKVACMRPSSFADMIQTGQAKLNKAFFNPASFAEELAAAYDLAALKFNRKKDGDILLGTIYKMLVPMARSRREYDQQSYAFDIARLYNRKNEVAAIKDGRHFQFGPSHNNGKALRILDAEGKEQYLATVRFYQ